MVTPADTAESPLSVGTDERLREESGRAAGFLESSRVAWAQTGYPAAEGAFGWGESLSRVRPNKSFPRGRRGAKPPANDIAVADQSRIVCAWVDYLSQWEWDWFCTLTFRNEVHPEAAAKRFAVFVSKINRAMFGPRWWKKGDGARWVRALEYQRRGVIHYHALLGGVGLSEMRRFQWIHTWHELAGYARIEPPRDGRAVHRYCSKYVAKGGEIDIGGPLGVSPQQSLDF